MVSQAVLIPHTMMDGKHTNMAARPLILIGAGLEG